MVKYQHATQNAALDRMFSALADSTRRALLARLNEEDGMSVSELAEPFKMSLPAVMKHLDVLADAGLIARNKTGRTVACQLTAAPMEQAMHWLIRYQRFWTEQLDRLAAFLEEETCPPVPSLSKSPQSSPASRSNVVSMRRRPKSTPRGRTPRS